MLFESGYFEVGQDDTQLLPFNKVDPVGQHTVTLVIETLRKYVEEQVVQSEDVVQTSQWEMHEVQIPLLR